MDDRTIPQQLEELRALLVEGLAALNKRIDTLTQTPPPEAPAAPARTDGLYRFQRPAVRAIDPWAGREMASADADEAFARALHGVNWRGGHVADVSYDEAWDEIERLQAGDEELISLYRDLDPEFAGFALLTGLISASKWNALSFGTNAKQRTSFAGYTIQSFMDAQMAVRQGGGSPSGA